MGTTETTPVEPRTTRMTWDNHLRQIISWISKRIYKKYEEGQRRHGGDLWRKPTWKHMKAELVDMVVYFEVHDQHLTDIEKELRQAEIHWSAAEDSEVRKCLQRALNILRYGNPKGHAEPEHDAGVEEEM